MENFVNKIPKTVYDTLVSVGINSPQDILLLNHVELQEKTNISNEEAKNILREISNFLLANNVKQASDIPAWSRLTTGCESINFITNGGFPVHGITEIYGCAGVGKTQICLQTALTVQLPTNKGGLSRGAVYICTEDTFPVHRLRSLSRQFYKKYKLSESLDLMNNVFIHHSKDFEELESCFSKRLPILLEKVPIGLIVLDSIAGAFRSENEDCDYINRSNDFHLLAMKLQGFARKYNLAVICTNQVTDNISTGKAAGALGNAWKNLVTCRFKVFRISMESTLRIFEVINAPDLPPNKCNFIIKEDGVVKY